VVGSTQVGFPTTVTEGELENTLDRQLGKTRAEELEREWVTQDPSMEDLDRNTEPSEDTTWEPNPLPLMTKHSPRITVSNTKIQLEEGILRQPHPKGENDGPS
jgi:hypothetical protein